VARISWGGIEAADADIELIACIDETDPGTLTRLRPFNRKHLGKSGQHLGVLPAGVVQASVQASVQDGRPVGPVNVVGGTRPQGGRQDPENNKSENRNEK
jgi:hypothetical protein